MLSPTSLEDGRKKRGRARTGRSLVASFFVSRFFFTIFPVASLVILLHGDVFVSSGTVITKYENKSSSPWNEGKEGEESLRSHVADDARVNLAIVDLLLSNLDKEGEENSGNNNDNGGHLYILPPAKLDYPTSKYS